VDSPGSGSPLLESRFDSPYDQCGLMVRADDRNWLKAGIEHDGGTWFSVVETHENSDWSKQESRTPSAEFRVWRSGDTLRVGVVDERGTHLVRELIFDGDVAVGPYSCAPKGRGFDVKATASLAAEGEWTINAQAGPVAQ
jgi:regulation of enolase protein 1 (concanavalin A-like superfamily)